MASNPSGVPPGQHMTASQQSQQPNSNSQQQASPELIPTAVIQQYLEENDSLITTIVENINADRLKQCTQYQERLQQNLMYLAGIADKYPVPQQQHPS